MKIKDEVNHIYGNLTVISMLGRNQKGLALWLCKCVCGKTREVTGTDLRRGRVLSCGCINSSGRKNRYLIGKRYNHLLVLEKIRHDNHRIIWKCLCDCGNMTEVNTSSLINNHTQSCGCLHEETVINLANKKRLPDNLGLVRRLYNHYKNGSKKRNKEFILTLDEFAKLIKGNCYYCGEPPKQIFRRDKTTGVVLYYNGIDRLKNNTGYILENCVSCCWVCNKLKACYDDTEFIDQITKIVKHIALKGK